MKDTLKSTAVGLGTLTVVGGSSWWAVTTFGVNVVWIPVGLLLLLISYVLGETMRDNR